jgi:N-acetylmuramoyl-L-alanine amidase
LSSPAAAVEGVSPPLPGQGGIIVLDPGHGGRDHGVEGSSELLEKDVALEVATRLKEKLEANLGLKVLMTRSGDYSVEPLERAAIANHNKASLFLSIHLGSSMDQKADIFTVFFPEERRPSRGSDTGGAEVPWRIWKRQYQSHYQETLELAEVVRGHLREWLLKELAKPVAADLLVLKGIDCPAVLVELGYLTNPERERMYGEETFVEELSRILYMALAEFLEASYG